MRAVLRSIVGWCSVSLLVALLMVVWGGVPVTGATTIITTNLGLAGEPGRAAVFGFAFTATEAAQGAGGTDLNGDGDSQDRVVHVWREASGGIDNLRLAGNVEAAADDGFVFVVDEAAQGSGGTDLNGDGDRSDLVLHKWEAATGTITNLALAGGAGSSASPSVGFMFAVDEAAQGGTDLNGDGDHSDSVLHVLHASSGTITNLGLAGRRGPGSGFGFGFRVDEAAQGAGGTDLNGDGDRTDFVVHVWTVASGTTSLGLAGIPSGAAEFGFGFSVDEAAQGVGGTDFNGDGDRTDFVVHVWSAASATARNLNLAGFSGPAAGFGFQLVVDEGAQGAGGTDLNGDGDATDRVVHVWQADTSLITNLRLAGRAGVAAPFGFGFEVDEGAQGPAGTDLNGDGDELDRVLHVWDAATATTTNLGLAGGVGRAAAFGFSLTVDERAQGTGGTDLNGDGDQVDFVYHVWGSSARSVTNLGLAAATLGTGTQFGFHSTVAEAAQGRTDLNGDGDAADKVVHVVTLNDAPVAVNDGPFAVLEGGTLAGDGLLDNDTDAEADPLTAVPGIDPAHGTMTLEPDGSFSYVHDGSETTTDAFTYIATDGVTPSNEATVSIAITPVNDPPVAVDDGPYMVDQGGTLDVGGVLDNDTDAEGDPLTAAVASEPSHGAVSLDLDGSFTYVHDGSNTTTDSFTYRAHDGRAHSNPATVTIRITPTPASVGLVDPAQGKWHLADGSSGAVTSFYYGDPGDIPFLGDWDCDGEATPGLFRTSDAFAYLRNSNTAGIADIRFYFGNPEDIPLAGDFDGDCYDTLSIYRPSEQRFYIINKLGENEGGLGKAEYSFTFGNPGDKPVVGDWDGDGIDEVGLHRESTGYFYYRNSLDTGVADDEFYFGDPGDRFVAGDWGTIDGAETPAVFRPSNTTFYFRWTNTPGVADSEFVWGERSWLPVSGVID